MTVTETDIEFVHSIVRKNYSRNTPFDMDDLISEGMGGLLDAVTRHDETKGKRHSYLYRRILGAVQDYLRYKFKHGRSRTVELPMLPLEDWANDPLLSVDGTEQRIANKQVWELIRKTLEPKKTVMLGLYFFDGYTMKEIGKLFSLTESRISQIMRETFVEVGAILQDEL